MIDYGQLKTIGKSLYKTNIPKEMKRYLVFLGRCCLHKKEINDLQKFYEQNKQIYSWNIPSINKSCIDLYQLGVIGNCTIYPGKKKKNTYWFSYRDGSPKEPDMNKDFSVHLALVNNFSL